MPAALHQNFAAGRKVPRLASGNARFPPARPALLPFPLTYRFPLLVARTGRARPRTRTAALLVATVAVAILLHAGIVARTAGAGSTLPAGIVFVALAACAARFFRREFMGRALFMRGTSAFAGDFSLLGGVHGSEATLAGIALLVAAAAAAATTGFTTLLFIVARCGHDDLLDRWNEKTVQTMQFFPFARQGNHHLSAHMGRKK